MYSLVAFLILLNAWAFVSVAGISNRRATSAGSRTSVAVRWIIYVVTASLSLHTQYYAAFVLAAQLAFLLWRRRHQSRLWSNWILAQIVILISFLPWLVYAGLQLVAYVGRKVAYEKYSPIGFLDFFRRFFVAFSEGTEHPAGWQWVAVPVFAVTALGVLGHVALSGDPAKPAKTGFWPWLRRITRGTWSTLSAIPEGVLLCALVLAITGLAGWLVNQILPFSPPRWERLYLFSLPFFIMLMASGIKWLGNLRPGLVWLGLTYCLAIAIPPLHTFYTVERYPGDDYRPLVRTASAVGRPDDLVATVYPWQIGFFQSYYRGPWPHFALMFGEEWNDPNHRSARLNAFGREHDRIWVPAYQALGGVFERQVETFMVGHFFPAINEWYGNTRLLLFHTGQEPPHTPDEVNFDGQLKLLNYGVNTESVEAAKGSVDVVLFWLTQKQLSGKLVVKLRLFDQEGHTWTQRDSEPQGGLMPAVRWTIGDSVEDRHSLYIPAGTPPGTYNLGLSLTMDGRSLNIVEADGNPHGQELALARVEVHKPGFTPSLDSLPVRTRLTKDMGDGIEAVGYSMGNGVLKPGETTLIDAFWRATRVPKSDHEAVFQLVDHKGKVLSEQRKPVGQNYPARGWAKGELVRDQYEVAIPAATPNGSYDLRLSFDDDLRFVRFDKVRVEGREHTFSPPEIVHSMASHFGDSITLAGFDINGQARPSGDGGSLAKIRAGDSLTLKLLWKAESEVGRNLTVFTHIVDSSSRIWGQKDSVPGRGTMPTNGWVQGEYLVDSYEIVLKPDTPAGPVDIVVGFYDPVSGRRLATFGADGQPSGDKAILGRLEVER